MPLNIAFNQVSYHLLSFFKGLLPVGRVYSHETQAARNNAAFNTDFRDAMDKIGDNVWEHDFTTGLTRFSKNIEQLLGYQLQKNTNKVDLWWTIIHPDDKHLLEQNDRGYKNGTLSSHSAEYRVTHKDGSVRWIHDRGVVISKSADGKPLKIIGTHADITNRKLLEIQLGESETRFRDMAKNVPGVVYQWREDMHGVAAFTYVSPRLKEYFDIEPGNMDMLFKFIHPDDAVAWQQSVDASRTTGNPWKFEGRLLYPGGSIKWFRGQSVMSSRNEQGVVYNGIMMDITEEMRMRQLVDKKEKENKQQVMKAIINAQENERQIISYDLHDNVNQILATTKLVIDLVNKDQPNTFAYLAQGKENIQLVMDEIRNISHGLNSSILHFVGLEGAIHDLLRKVNDTKSVFFTAEVSEGLTKDCLGKEVELTIFRIIQSQVSNILKHSRATQASIVIKANCHEINVSVTDNGIGFAVSDKAFGLGLINIKHRVEIFNGKVDIQSSPGLGCTLTVFIPLQELH